MELFLGDQSDSDKDDLHLNSEERNFKIIQNRSRVHSAQPKNRIEPNIMRLSHNRNERLSNLPANEDYSPDAYYSPTGYINLFERRDSNLFNQSNLSNNSRRSVRPVPRCQLGESHVSVRNNNYLI